MATDTLPVFRASSEPGEPTYLIRYPFNGETYVAGFDKLDELIHAVTSKKDRADNYLPTDVVNLIVDFAEESLEWNAAPPVAEAVCDCDLCVRGFNAGALSRVESDLRSFKRLVGWSALIIGAVAWWVRG